MDFNPDKCEVITITNKRKTIRGTYFIHQQQLKETDKAKYLVITIDSKLRWNHHINANTKKENYTTAFLRRNLISTCLENIKLQTYKGIVRPQLEHAGVVWGNSTKKNNNAVGKVHRRAAICIMNDYSQTGGYPIRPYITSNLCLH